MQADVQQSLPSGLVYIDNFLTPEEQQRVFEILDSNSWSKELVRRQQFYGPVYYFTPQALCSSLQPVSDKLKSSLIGDIGQSEDNQDDNNNNSSNNNLNLSTTITNENTDINIVSNNISDQYHDKQETDLPHHSLTQLQWVVDKLIAANLFERADVRDPYVEYITDDKHQRLYRVERSLPHPLPHTTPQSPEEEQRAKIKLQKQQEYQQQKQQQTNITSEVTQDDDDNNGPPIWGDLDFYPDQILVNEYLKKQGIGAHYDDALSFGPQIIGVSLGNSSTLVLSRPGCCSEADQEIRQVYDLRNDIQHNNNNNNNGNDAISNTQTQCHNSQQQHIKEQLNNSDTTNVDDDDDGFIRCDGHTVDDIENLGDFYAKFTKAKEKHIQKQQQEIQQNQEQNDPNNLHELSYNLSLRDYTRNDWKTGAGPEILSKYCRCTRQEMLVKYYRNHKYLLNLPILIPDHLKPGAAAAKSSSTTTSSNTNDTNNTDNNENDNNTNNNNNNNNHDNDTYSNNSNHTNNEDPYSENSTTQQPYSASNPVNPKLTRWDLKKQGIYNEFVLQNLPISQTEEDVHNFVMKYDYYSLPHRTFHSRSGEETTTQYVKDNIATLREQTRHEVDAALMPTLRQFNQCKHPREVIEVELKPGSVYVMAGQARYQYRHAIKRGGKDQPDGFRRVSLTIRSLLPGRRQVVINSDQDLALAKRELYGVSYDHNDNNNSNNNNNNNNHDSRINKDNNHNSSYDEQ